MKLDPSEYPHQEASRIRWLYSQHMKHVSQDNEEEEVNADGGRQSPTDLDYTLLPVKAIDMVGLLMTEAAAKYERDNWRKISARDHINHAIRHAFMWIRNGNNDELVRAACRMLFALETQNSDVE